jgi:hypothetical protein
LNAGAGALGLTAANGLQTTNQPTNAAGVVFRNGCNRIANSVTTVGSFTNAATRCFPENYLISNPQLSGASYIANLGHNNYHSLQTQLSMRPVQGISFQSTYSWAKGLGTPSTFTDPLNRAFDYSAGGGNLTSTEPKHTFRMNGTFEMPFGPNKLLFGNASGWVARAIERWSTSIILNLQSGSLYTVGGAGTMRYANGRYNATQYWTVPERGDVQFVGANANYFGQDMYFRASDPQCSDSTFVSQAADPVTSGTAPSTLASLCTMSALGMQAPAGTPGSFTRTNGGTGVFVLVNPHPGEYGNVAPSQIEGPGSWSLNANVGKTFQLTESKQLTVRMDATNILNHPSLNPVSVDASEAFGTRFGQISGKGGTPRNFQASIRMSF